jgi:hypothetical protein
MLTRTTIQICLLVGKMARFTAPVRLLWPLNQYLLTTTARPETTGNLIKHMLRVDPKWVNPLPENEAVEIPDTGGVKVTLVDANHCWFSL